MIGAIQAGVGAGSTAAARPPDDPAKVKDAAKQFEALLIGQMMKSMHDSEGGWLGTVTHSLDKALYDLPVSYRHLNAVARGLGGDRAVVALPGVLGPLLERRNPQVPLAPGDVVVVASHGLRGERLPANALDSMDHENQPDAMGLRRVHPAFHFRQRRAGKRTALPLDVFFLGDRKS